VHGWMNRSVRVYVCLYVTVCLYVCKYPDLLVVNTVFRKLDAILIPYNFASKKTSFFIQKKFFFSKNVWNLFFA
jgi:hypothetical protein